MMGGAGQATNRGPEGFVGKRDDALSVLVAAMEFSDAAAGFILSVSSDGLEPIAVIGRSGDQIESSAPAFVLEEQQAAMISHLMESGKLQRRSGEKSSAGLHDVVQRAAICVPVSNGSEISSILYLEGDTENDAFSPHIENALSLFAVALRHIPRLQAQHSVTGVEGGTYMIDPPSEPRQSCQKALDQQVLSGIADSIAISVNDSLSAVVAHASAGLQWLNQTPPKIDKARHSFRKIASSAFSAGGILTSYRTPDSPERLKLDHFDLEDVISGALLMIDADLRACNVDSICDLSAGKVVYADRMQIEHAVSNLISIAVDAMKEVNRPRNLRISSELQDKHLVLAVSDSGLDIPLEARDAIFDPLYTTKQGSRGIKLAIARTIAQLHGGSLEIARYDGCGTTMLLKLPTTGTP